MSADLSDAPGQTIEDAVLSLAPHDILEARHKDDIALEANTRWGIKEIDTHTALERLEEDGFLVQVGPDDDSYTRWERIDCAACGMIQVNPFDPCPDKTPPTDANHREATLHA